MNEELTKIDRILDDKRFFAPFLERFYSRVGRPTIPVATYLRMMYLKRRYKLGYETLVKEVSDSFMWRRFCHISVEDRVPDDTTLIKLTKKYGEDTLDELNDALVLKLKEEKVIRGKKLRMDTMVTEANIHYPTDTGLLADGIRVITRTVARIKQVSGGIGDGFVNHTRKVKKICLGISKLLRGRISKDNARVVKAKEKLIEIAEEVVVSGRMVKEQLDTFQKKPSQNIPGLVEQMGRWLDVTEQILHQTETVLIGCPSIPQRVVSIFDTGARPIRRGKARVDTEFGRKVLIGETDHGIITTHRVLEGNPADATLLKVGVKGHRRLFRKRLKAVATDRGFYSQGNEDWLQGSVKQVSIPVRGKASKQRLVEQKQPWFKRLQRFRAGSEGRISLLKRMFGLGRSLMRGNKGAQVWAGQGIFAHNLWQAARIM
jgi:IS5 family transposase